MVGGVRAPALCRETQPWSRQVSASPSAGILCSGRGRQTGGGGDDAGLGEELGQLKRGGRRPMSRTWALLRGRGRGHGRDFVQKQGEYIVNQGGPLDFNAESRIPEKA